VSADRIPEVIQQLQEHGMTALSETQDQSLEITQKILELAF